MGDGSQSSCEPDAVGAYPAVRIPSTRTRAWTARSPTIAGGAPGRDAMEEVLCALEERYDAVGATVPTISVAGVSWSGGDPGNLACAARSVAGGEDAVGEAVAEAILDVAPSYVGEDLVPILPASLGLGGTPGWYGGGAAALASALRSLSTVPATVMTVSETIAPAPVSDTPGGATITAAWLLPRYHGGLPIMGYVLSSSSYDPGTVVLGGSPGYPRRAVYALRGFDATPPTDNPDPVPSYVPCNGGLRLLSHASGTAVTRSIRRVTFDMADLDGKPGKRCGTRYLLACSDAMDDCADDGGMGAAHGGDPSSSSEGWSTSSESTDVSSVSSSSSACTFPLTYGLPDTTCHSSSSSSSISSEAGNVADPWKPTGRFDATTCREGWAPRMSRNVLARLNGTAIPPTPTAMVDVTGVLVAGTNVLVLEYAGEYAWSDIYLVEAIPAP